MNYSFTKHNIEQEDGNVQKFIKQLKKKKRIDHLSKQQSQSYISSDFYHLQPLFVTSDSLKLAFVDCYDWEERENLFLIQYKKIKKEQINFAESSVEVILETLPIHIQTETIITKQTIGIIDDKGRNFKRKIYPQSSKINIDLPFINPNLSVKHLHFLMSLKEMWSTQGYSFYDIIGQPEKIPTFTEVIPDDERQRLKKKFNLQCVTSCSELSIPQEISDFLENHRIEQLELNMDGLLFQLNLYTKECIQKWEQFCGDKETIQINNQMLRKQMLHQNSMFQFQLENMKFQQDSHFFKTFQNLAIQDFIIHRSNCYNFFLRAPLKIQTVNLLSQNDYNNQKEQTRMKQKQKLSQKSKINQSTSQKDKFGDDLLKAMNNISEIHEDDIEINFIQKSQTLNNSTYQSNQTFFQDCFQFEPFIEEFWILKSNEKYEKKCRNSGNQNLSLNFIKSQQNQLPDIYMFWMSSKDQSEMQIELQTIVITLEPLMISQLRLLFDVCFVGANIYREQFEQWMRTNGFWPDFHDCNKQIQKEEQVNKISRIEIIAPQITLQCGYQLFIQFLLNITNLNILIYSNLIETQIEANFQNLRLYDTSNISGNHREIISGQNDVTCQINVTKDREIAIIRKYTTSFGVRIRNAVIVFLKRNTTELQYYFRKIAIDSFYTKLTAADKQFILNKLEQGQSSPLVILQELEIQQDENLHRENFNKQFKNKDQNINNEQKLRFSMVALNCHAIGYRNSISNDGLFIWFTKAGYWFTGQWGTNFDSLIKTGLFNNELEQMESIQQDSIYVDGGVFYEAMHEQKQKDQHDQGTETFYSMEQENFDTSSQMVMVWDLEVRTSPVRIPETIFIKAGKEPLKLEIIWEDKTFKTYYKDNQNNPMRSIFFLKNYFQVNIILPEAKIFAYDLDYCTICKFFQENLGEQAQTIINPTPWDLKNENIWMYLDITINRAIGKFFKGTREDIENYYKKLNMMYSFDSQERKKNRKHEFLYKNPASIALAKLKRVNYKFMMRENGGKLMKLIVQEINLADFRQKSKLLENKWILFAQSMNQFKNEDEMTNEQNQPFEYEFESESEFDSFSLNKDEEMNKLKRKMIKKGEAELKEKIADQSQVPANIFTPRQSKDQGAQLLYPEQQKKVEQQKSSFTEKIKNIVKRMLCCKKQKKQRKPTYYAEEQRIDQLEQSIQSPERILNSSQQQLFNYEYEQFPSRRWINYRLQQTLPVTIFNDKDDYDKLKKEDIESGGTEQSDFRFIMTSKPDGEKQIKMIIEDKNLIVILDFIMEIVQFFRTPYNGSDNQEYQYMPIFNNYPPMILEVKISNVWAIIPGDFNFENQSVAILLDAVYRQSWRGDNWFGPGSCTKFIEAVLKKVHIFKSDQLIQPKKVNNSPLESLRASQLQSKGVKFREFTFVSGLRSLIEPFKITFNTTYALDFWRKSVDPQLKCTTIFDLEGEEARLYYADIQYNSTEDFKSHNDLNISFANNKKLKNNISISISEIAIVTKILGNFGKSSVDIDQSYKMTRKQPPDWDFKDYCISSKMITIQALRIQFLKNKDGVKVAMLGISDLELRQLAIETKSRMLLQSSIKLDYFNKRKLDFEPLVESWKFMIKMVQINENLKEVQKIKLSNRLDETISGSDSPFYLKDHNNSLNINVTTAMIETGMEALKIFKGEMKDGEPYKIFNRSGYPLELRDVKRDASLSRIKENGAMQWEGWRDLYAMEGGRRSQREGGQQMLVNILILKRELMEDEDEVIEDDFIEEQSIIIQTKRLKPGQKKYFRSDISNYKTIKYVSLDHVGKRFYPLEKIHRNEQSEGPGQKKNGALDMIKSNLGKITGGFLSNNRKINEEGNIHLLVNVNINPKNGSKEISISSSVRFYNFLDVAIEVGFLANGQMKEALKKVIEPKQFFNIPLEFLENKTEARFSPVLQKGLKHHFSEYECRYYQLDMLICDGTNLNDFEIDDENTVSDVLQQSEQYVYLNEEEEIKETLTKSKEIKSSKQLSNNDEERNKEKGESVIKSEFKSIQNCLIYKNDHQIYSTKQVKASAKNFFFIMSCVKIKNKSTNQKQAYLQYAGISKQFSEENEEEDLTCYETFLIFYPVFKITNATIRSMTLFQGIQSTSEKSKKKSIPNQNRGGDTNDFLDKVIIYPGDSYFCYKLDYSEDLVLQIQFPTYERSKYIRIFQKWFVFTEKRSTFDIPFKKKKVKKQLLYLLVSLTKLSQKTCDLIIYSPYLIMNQTDKIFIYREYGLTKDIISSDNVKMNNQIEASHRPSDEDEEFHHYFEHDEYQNRDRLERVRYEEELKLLHMFSTSTNIKKMQLALVDQKNLQISSWSKPVSLQNNEAVIQLIGAQENYRKAFDSAPRKFSSKNKLEFGMKITSAPGIFFRSKLIILSPRYMVHNETKLFIALAQADAEFQEEYILRVKPGEWKSFYWPESKKRDNVIMSYYEQATGHICGWSGQFKINNVCELSLKLTNPKQANNDEIHQILQLQKVNISLIDDSILLVRFLHEDTVVPPYYIENNTKYEISFKQRYQKRSDQHQQQHQHAGGIQQVFKNAQQNETISIAAGGNQVTFLQPGERVAFVWDHWIDDSEHALEVEIEGISKEYHIDKIQDFEPIVLPGQQKRKINKNYLYKQGVLNLKEVDKFLPVYCVLSVLKQKLKVYTMDRSSREVYSLNGAKLEESRETEFLLVIDPKKITTQTLHFQAENQIVQEWTDYFWRAILINKPDMVELKIEPMNQTKVLSFFIMREAEEEEAVQKLKLAAGKSTTSISNIIRPSGEDEDINELRCQKVQLKKYQINISNCIGISLIDSLPREIIQVSLKNFQFRYNSSDQKGQNECKSISEAAEEEKGEDKIYLLQLKKEYINLTVDLVVINNQLLDAQFPVLLAPNKKKVFGEQQPFLMVSLYWRDQNKEAAGTKIIHQSPKISYIHTFSVFTDTLEIRLDDYILDAIFCFIEQVQILLVDNQNDDLKKSPWDFRTLQSKLEQKLEWLNKQNVSHKYVKNLMMEPMDICFTFRSSPGHTMNLTTKNYVTDLGLTLASIDSAKIKLNALKTQHIFGSSNDIISRISKHYSRQFLSQLYKLFGSFELLGNPVSLIENLGTGVLDMFYEPLYALVKGKSGFKVGEKFVSGAMSLIQHSISGVYKTINKILGTIMKILASFTFDKRYIHERQNRLNRTIKNFKEGIIIGFKNFVAIIFETLFGVFERPITEARLSGFLGFFLGLYQGLIGIIVKPTVGIFDLLTTIIEGIKNTAIYEEHIMDTRYRPPRIFGENNLLIPFEFIPAIGTDILRKFKLKPIDLEIKLQPGKSRSKEAQIVLTDIRVVYVLTHSSIHYDKIMVYKLASIKYNRSQRKLVFQFHTPIKRNFLGSKTYNLSLKYENAKKAARLIQKMKDAFGDKYSIKFEIPEY